MSPSFPGRQHSLRPTGNPSSDSVKTRSYPDWALGPVPIDAQKHVSNERVQLTAIKEQLFSSSLVIGILVNVFHENLVLNRQAS